MTTERAAGLRVPRTTKGLALRGALRKPRTMPDEEVDWGAWIAGIEDEAALLAAPVAAHPHPCQDCDATVDYWVTRALAAPVAVDCPIDGTPATMLACRLGHSWSARLPEPVPPEEVMTTERAAGLREALIKIANWHTHGPLVGRDADTMAALARSALDAAALAAPVAVDVERLHPDDGYSYSGCEGWACRLLRDEEHGLVDIKPARLPEPVPPEDERWEFMSDVDRERALRKRRHSAVPYDAEPVPPEDLP